MTSLADSHAPATIRRRLAALGKMHRFNALAWNPAHRAIRGALLDALHTGDRPARKAAALSLDHLRQLVATCEDSPRGRRDRALLLFGFTGALRRAELVSIRVEDVAIVADGLRLRLRPGQTGQAGQGAAIDLPRGRHAELCPVRAFEAWQAVAKRRTGPLFRKISTAGSIGGQALHPDAVRHILVQRVALAGIVVDNCERLSAQALRAGYIAAAFDRGVPEEAILRHTRHRDRRTLRGSIRLAGPVRESPADRTDP